MTSRYAQTLAQKRADELCELISTPHFPGSWDMFLEDLSIRLKSLSKKLKEIEATRQT